MDSKVVITGTGRCGTSFIMQLLTNCSLNTGYTPEEAKIAIERIDGLNAGIEHATEGKRIVEAKYIKNPSWIIVKEFERLRETHKIQRVIIPVRDLTSTAKSRELMTKETHAGYGGFWLGAKDVESQKTINARLFYQLINHLIDNQVKHNFISFKKMMSDGAYLYRALGINDEVSFGDFMMHYNNLRDPSKIRF